ncbi:ABC transporter substrate-binding protein [Nocardioides sp.]|uniref:ABC transporter substrate-binding protein n=1 Tax=Nocardioides sp. TaxID=35761 RepID=UPI003D14086F
MSETDRPDPPLTFRILGPLEVSLAGSPLPLGGRQQRALLALLLCNAGQAVSVGRLVREVWGEPAPPGAVTSVQTYVFHLRQILEPNRPRGVAGSTLVTSRAGYRLDVAEDQVDVKRFEDLVREGDALLAMAAAGRALAAYREALSLWRGDVLADLSDYDFVSQMRTRLEETRASAIVSGVQAELDLGHHAGVVAQLGGLISEHPLHEGLWAQRILALYRSNRQSDALAAYRQLRTILDAELGIEPSPALRELNNRVLQQDATLAWRPPQPDQAPSARAPQYAASAGPPADPGAGQGGHRTRARIRALLAVSGVVAALVGGAAAHDPSTETAVGLTVAAPPANAVSQLDETGSVVRSVPVGTNPTAVSAGPDAVWVVNASDDTVSRIDPDDHVVQQVIAVGHDPRALVRTGDDLWVTNFGDGTVTRINVPANEVVDTIRVGSDPDAIAAGPAGLWVANSGDNTVQRLDTVTGVGEKPIEVGDGPDGLAVDDTTVWVANGREGSVMRIEAESGAHLSAPIRVGSGPRGIVRVGDDVWVADELSETVSRIDVATLHTHSIDVGDGPNAVVSWGGAIWVAEKAAGDLVRIDPETEKQRRVDLRAPVNALAAEGDRMWVAAGAFASSRHRGGSLRVAAASLPGWVSRIDPARVYDRTTLHATRVVYDGLLAYHYASADPQTLVPDLATSVPEPTDGDTTYTFTLRPGIRYSTGVEVRASDFRRGVHRALVATDGRPDFYAGIIGGQRCIERPRSCDLSRGVDVDDATGRVTFHLRAPDPQFLYKLTLLVFPAPRGTPIREVTRPLPGTGPYQISTYVVNERFTLTRNPYFHEWSSAAQPAGFPDDLTWIKVADAGAAADAVRRGQADLAELTPLGEQGAEVGALVDRLKLTSPSRVHSSLVQATSFGFLNASRPPFDHPKARRALNFAFDRRRAVQLLGGSSVARATCQLMPPGMPSYRPYCPFTTGSGEEGYRGPDLARARTLVAESGTAGMQVDVSEVVGGDPNPPLASYLARVLRSLGYAVTFHALPDTDRGNRYFYDPLSGNNVGTGGWIADFPLPSNFYDLVACGGGGGYPIGYCNPGLDRRANAASSIMPSDPGEALQRWGRIERRLTDLAPLVPMTNDIDSWVTSQSVGNYQVSKQEVGPLLSQLWVR